MTDPALMTAKIMAYDTSYSDSYSLVGLNEYERTYELCNEHTVCMFSGNVIKLNSYSLKEPYIVNNHDSEFCKTLEQLRIENSVVYDEDDSYGDDAASGLNSNLSDDETAARLLTDTEYSYGEPSGAGYTDSGFISDDSEIITEDEY